MTNRAGWQARMVDLRPVGDCGTAYSHAGHDDDGSPRITEGRLTAEHQTATRFRRDRRAPFIPSPGLPMPYAHTSGPGLLAAEPLAAVPT